MKKLLITIIILSFAFAKTTSAQNETSTSDSSSSVTLYWDVSFSMQKRDLRGEFERLDTFFKTVPQATVTCISFSNSVIAREQFSVKDSNWDMLKAALSNSIYDGSTDFDVVDFNTKADYYIVSTDGSSIYNDISIASPAPVTVIQSVTSNKTTRLNLLANSSKGDFTSVIPNNSETNGSEVFGTVTGSIADGVGPIANVSVRIEDTDKGTFTDTNGQFSISVKPGNILVFSYVGKKTKRVRVTDKRTINLNLDFTDESLDEVVLTTKKEEENTINTGYGKLRKDQLGYDVKSIGDEDIKEINTDVSTAVQGKFSGVVVNPTRGLARAQIRTVQTLFGNTNPLIVIDGIPTVQRDSSTDPNSGALGFGEGIQSRGIEDLINPEDIADITILKSHAATNKYGTLGVNGVILITSKTGQAAKNINNGGKKKKVGTTDTYSGSAETISELANTSYINELKIATSVDNAYDIYLKQRDIHGNKAAFYLDVADYFKGWNNQFIVNRVLSNVLEVATDDLTMLRALAYKYEATNQRGQAAKIYEYILKTSPQTAQAYRDLALAYADAGQAQKALTIYEQIDKGASGKATFNPIQESLTKELRNFVRKYKSSVATNTLNAKYTQQVSKLDKRIVIEWNDPKAEFDLQIINPQNRYFTWSHTQKEAYQRLVQESNIGFNMEEFFLTNGDKGLWRFNVVNYGFIEEDKGQPVFMKFTIYDNYGTAQERKRIKFVRLSEIDKELNVLSINI